MIVQVFYHPHDYVTVDFLNDSGEVIDTMTIPKDVDVERFIQNTIKERERHGDNDS